MVWCSTVQYNVARTQLLVYSISTLVLAAEHGEHEPRSTPLLGRRCLNHQRKVTNEAI